MSPEDKRALDRMILIALGRAALYAVLLEACLEGFLLNFCGG